MKKNRKFFKYKFKYFVAVSFILCLFLFGSLSSAALALSNDQYSFMQSVPVPLEFHYRAFEDVPPDPPSYYTYCYTYLPVLSTSLDNVDSDFEIRDVVSCSGGVDLEFTSVTVPGSSNSDTLLSSDFGRFSVTLHGPDILYLENNALSLNDFRVEAHDFYVWNGNFNQTVLDDTHNEVSFSIHSDLLDQFAIKNLLVRYGNPGDESISTVNFTPNDGTAAGDDLASGTVDVRPEYFDDLDADAVYYIYDIVVTFVGLPTLLSSPMGLKLYVDYTCNPYLENYGAPDSPSDPDSDNPAIPLISYTTWLGTAVSGFLDLEIFPNFTLGGIFMTILAFMIVVWFLKLVAGG